MKINLRKTSILEDGDKNYKISRKIKTGIITAALIVGIPALMFNSNKKNEYDYSDNPPADIREFEEVVSEEPIDVSLEDINSLNIIINDNDCSDTFMESIYNRLEKDGIKFIATKNSNNVDVDNSVVVTLDQQYISGPSMIVLAPYNNERNGNSDALALAANTAFYEKGFFTDGIECGKRGFREKEDGTILERIPTDTEEKISQDKNTSFVTICFGTENVNSDLVVDSIENMLARYYSYINKNEKDDLIYRSDVNDNLDNLSIKYNTSVNYLKMINNINTDFLPVDTTIKHPNTENIREFDITIPISINDKTNNFIK